MLGNTLGYMATTCLILLVGGCAYQDGMYDSSRSATERLSPLRSDYNLEATDDTPRSSNKAVLALLEQSVEQAAAGALDKSVASLERALHIEPRNAFLYSQLAALRLEQERFEEAAALAGKSNSLADRDARLQERNWRLIAQARKGQGDEEGASRAEQRAAHLREFLEK